MRERNQFKGLRWIMAAASLLALALPFVLWSFNVAAPTAPANEGNYPSFALVELFTSEGCSSCPSADDLFAKVIEDAQKSKDPVYALSFHVDYWNRLGWYDRYSDYKFSERQRDYASAMDGIVYTPQTVVNGSIGFVGSDKQNTKAEISKALGKKALASVKASARAEENKIVLEIAQEGDFQNCWVQIAFVQDKAITKVEKGENEGRTLFHYNIVRELVTLEPQPESFSHSVKTPKALLDNEGTIMVFLQNKSSREIHAATALNFPKL